MANIKFYLKDSKQSETAIYARISYRAKISQLDKNDYIQLKYYISKSINPNFWNQSTNRAIKSNKFPEHPEFNNRLDIIESTIKSAILKLENSNIPLSNVVIKAELDKMLKPELSINTAQVPTDFFPFIDYLIQTSNNKQSTLKSYKVVKKNLQDYQSAKKIALTFNSIDIDFYNSFIEFLTKSGLSKNTIGTRIKILKTFLSEANDRGINVPDDYRKRTFKKPNEETDSIYLNEKELMQIFNIEKNPESIKIINKEHRSDKLPEYLTKVRDLFLVGCYTGLRFSDLTQLRKENITADETINIKTQKTNQIVVVPIHPITRLILEKYDYQLPRAISNQKFNVYLKEIGRIAGINEKVTTEITKGGFKVSTTTEKYNLICSHCSRRSFATNAFLADMPSISIMKITGHKTESAFMKYIKMSAKDNAAKMKSHKFFNPMLIAK